MALLLAVAVLVTAASALMLVTTLGAANQQVERLVTAQSRLELLSGISARIGDYALVALRSAQDPSLRAQGAMTVARQAVLASFERFEAALEADVGRLGDEEQRTLMAARSRTVARLGAQFQILDRQIETAFLRPDPADGVRVALDVFAAGFGAPLGQAMEDERATAHDAQAAVAQLRARSLRWGLSGVLLAFLIAVFIYHRLGRSLVHRVADVATAASALAKGRSDTRLTVTGHDELSLAMARFNRMAAHLARREGRLVAARKMLQETVDSRTAELRAANARLESVDLARRRFFTDVSHELRTPLTVILGEAEITLRAAHPPEAELRSALVTIQTRARKLHRRVEDLLRIARSESGQIELERSLFPVRDLMEDVRESMGPLARAAGLTLELAEAEEGLLLNADRDWLRQTLDGLVANAIRHSSFGGSIGIEAGREAGMVVLTVRDEGSGIPEAELPHVFERFWRGVAGQHEGTGFGIGLALAKWIIDRHGGRIDIESKTGREEGARSGTRVTIRLPSPETDIRLEAAQ
ncbi:sensor histidine kinase [Ancylobacter mangrovi]|uniref:sensor histidine kinase n=1 Tax=Ancylobacter mangrovi TaxID=2972472 RepID=UPI0021623E36|nr:HAMP domain-containing sensor histidine kinase [Ancylobacter mangrovi]MCS0504233.1 HAMP domain-containing histidine kinase [Ancylobacter mangrovi]